jgi:hypothetical protein
LIPFPDESIVSSLNGIISIFQEQEDGQSPSEEELRRTLNSLKSIKIALEKICKKSTKLNADEESERVIEIESSTDQTASNNESTSTETLKSSNEVIRNSLEMLQNGGRFTKLIDNKSSIVNNKKDDSSNKSSKKFSSFSKTSLRNSMIISSLSFERRKSPPNHKLSGKISRQVKLKKASKKVEPLSKQPTLPSSEKIDIEEPKIVSTCFARCRIHSYDDDSHTFEIIKPNRVNCFGDDNEKSEIVFVVLANGQTALFRSKSSKSLVNILSFGES